MQDIRPMLRDARLWSVYALTFTYFVAIFTVFAYVGPMLVALVPMEPRIRTAIVVVAIVVAVLYLLRYAGAL